jgi:DNA polymerase-3 subunit gamma/tau
VLYCGTNLTRQAVTENLNVLDYESYITVTDLILENKIPELLMSLTTFFLRDLIHIILYQD